MLKYDETKVTDKLGINQVIKDKAKEYPDVPSNVTEEGIVSFTMTLTDEDLKKIQETKSIHVAVLTFHGPLPPIKMTVDPEEFNQDHEKTHERLSKLYKEFLATAHAKSAGDA